MHDQIHQNNNHRIEKLLNFLESSPNDCFLLHALALEFIKNNDANQAINLFEKVLNIDQNYIGSYYHLGKLYYANSQSQKAIATFEKGIKIAFEKKDNHSANELRSVLDEILEDEE